MTTFNMILQDADAKEYQQGAVIFEQGDPGEAMYYVVAGEIEIRLKSSTINTIGADGIFGEMALLDDPHRSASAYAKTDCKLVLIDKNMFKSLVSDDPDFALKVMNAMSERLRKVTKLSIIEKIRVLNPTILQQLYLDE